MKIDRMFAFVSTDSSPDDEWVCAFLDPGTGVWLPMVGADMLRVESLRARAQEIADLTGQPIEVLEFSARKTIEIIRPTAEVGRS